MSTCCKPRKDGDVVFIYSCPLLALSPVSFPGEPPRSPCSYPGTRQITPPSPGTPSGCSDRSPSSLGMRGRSPALTAGLSRVWLFLVLRWGGALWSLSDFLASLLSKQQKKGRKKIHVFSPGHFFPPRLSPSAHIN